MTQIDLKDTVPRILVTIFAGVFGATAAYIANSQELQTRVLHLEKGLSAHTESSHPPLDYRILHDVQIQGLRSDQDRHESDESRHEQPHHN